MVLPTYQIDQVMKNYTKQLGRGRLLVEQKVFEASSGEKVDLSTEGKQHAVINKVAADIITRITSRGPVDDMDHQIVDRLQQEMGKKLEFKTEQHTQLVFNVINENDEKVTKRLSIEDSDFILKRLEQLAKETVHSSIKQDV